MRVCVRACVRVCVCVSDVLKNKSPSLHPRPPSLPDFLRTRKIQASVAERRGREGEYSDLGLDVDVDVSDLYDALVVAPTLKTGLLVESWQHAAPSVVLPNNCSAEYKARLILICL